MIKVFSGKWRGLNDGLPNFGMILSFRFREIVSEFKGAKLAVFLVIALHADENGVSRPSHDLLEKETGYRREAISKALKELYEMKIKGQHVLMKYREKNEKGHFIGPNNYIIFPTDEELTQSSFFDDTLEFDFTTVSPSEPEVKPKDSKVKPLNTGGSILDDSEVVDESNIVEWFEQRKKNGVRSSAEELPKPPRTEEEIRNRVANAVVSNQLRTRDKNPVIEMYLAKVPEHVRQLASAFCYGRGRPPRDKEDKMWRSEWQDQYELGLTAEHIEDAFEYHRRNNLSVRSPVSVLTVAENLRSGQIRMDFDQERSETSQNIAGARQVSAGDDGGDLDVMSELGMNDDG
jgi:hypothetical protein